jgi:thiamine transport system permease protein
VDAYRRWITTVKRSGQFAKLAVYGFLISFFVVPMILIGYRGLAGVDMDLLAEIPPVLWSTLLQSGASTCLALMIALPIAWAITQVPGRWADAVLLWVAVPFIVPTPVAAAMVSATCGPQSWCGSIFGVEMAQGFGFVIVVQAWYNAGLIVRVVSQAWSSISLRYQRAAATLSAPPWRQFWSVTFPLLIPSIVNSVLIVLLYCIGSFGIIVLLGGGRLVSLEVEIWRQTTQFLRIDIATLFALVQLLLSIALLTGADWIGTGGTFTPTMARPVPLNRWSERLALGVLMMTVCVFVIPYFTLLPKAFGTSEPFAAFQNLQYPVRGSGISHSPLAALWRSVWVAALVTVLTICIAWIATTPRTFLRQLVVLPLGVSTITLSLGYVLWFGSLGWLASPWVLVAVHTILATPLVARQVMVARNRLPTHYSDAAQTLGASPERTLRGIEIPMLRRPLVAAATFAYALSLGDYAAALVLTRPDSATAPLVIARMLNRPGAMNYAMSAALSVVFIVCCVAVMLVVQRASVDRER